ncbi:MAG: hypothetical protein PHV34_21935 [Verrucomicrobiae bacterium]|nr:hypothetical protein [Verrucomicrobiae bacterium]
MPLNQVWRDGWTHRRAGFWPDEPEKSLIRNRWLKSEIFDIEEAFGYNMGSADRREVKQIIFQHFEQIEAEWDSFQQKKQA